jgi:ABC-2 type transport system permease protein
MGLKETFNHSIWICWKDLLDFSRSKMGMIMVIIMPLFMMIMVGFIFPDSTVMMEDAPIAIANLDAGNMGANFTANLGAINSQSGMMVLTSATGMDEIRTQIYDGKIDGGIVISENFTADILSGRQGIITIITDQSNPQLALQTQTALSMTISQMGSYYAMGSLNQTHGIPANETLASIKPYSVEVESLIPNDPSYFQFVAPGIMAMVVMMSLMTGLPHAISYEKDTGTLDGMLVAPIRRLSIILGKVLAQTTRGMLQGLIILILAMVLFGVAIYGNVLLVFFIMFLSVFSFVGLGILITSFTDKEETASMMMMTIMFPMMFLGGVFFPIEQMPGFMQTISQFLPLTYATSALRKVIAFGLVFLAIAVPMFKRAMNR